MTLARDTTQEAAKIQRDIMRKLDGPTRLEMALRMSDEARTISQAGIRHRHPDWSEDQVRVALLELLLGADLAGTVLAARLVPTSD